MNKRKLVYKVGKKTGYSQTLIDKILCAAFETITETLSEGQKTTIYRFGTFLVKHMAKRNSRNPATGEPLVLAEKDVVKFKPSPHLLRQQK